MAVLAWGDRCRDWKLASGCLSPVSSSPSCLRPGLLLSVTLTILAGLHDLSVCLHLVVLGYKQVLLHLVPSEGWGSGCSPHAFVGDTLSVDSFLQPSAVTSLSSIALIHF